jgi:hypothetical protein
LTISISVGPEPNFSPWLVNTANEIKTFDQSVALWVKHAGASAIAIDVGAEGSVYTIDNTSVVQQGATVQKLSLAGDTKNTFVNVLNTPPYP